MRRPREEDKELARRLLDHLNENIERYHHAHGNSIESQKYDLCIPQFVSVDENADFGTVVQRFGLQDFKTDILVEANSTCGHLLSDANVRTVWMMAPFNENCPTT
jgi:hypothetical protein